jgi:hypothetical protein
VGALYLAKSLHRKARPLLILVLRFNLYLLAVTFKTHSRVDRPEG